jgi:hypothetical protein
MKIMVIFIPEELEHDILHDLKEEIIAEDELAVACYINHFGMAFMPEEVVKKQDALNYWLLLILT